MLLKIPDLASFLISFQPGSFNFKEFLYEGGIRSVTCFKQNWASLEVHRHDWKIKAVEVAVEKGR